MLSVNIRCYAIIPARERGLKPGTFDIAFWDLNLGHWPRLDAAIPAVCIS
jgi:hypothetical protein